MLYQQKLGSFFMWLKNQCRLNADVLEVNEVVKTQFEFEYEFNYSFSKGSDLIFCMKVRHFMDEIHFNDFLQPCT